MTAEVQNSAVVWPLVKSRDSLGAYTRHSLSTLNSRHRVALGRRQCTKTAGCAGQANSTSAAVRSHLTVSTTCMFLAATVKTPEGVEKLLSI